MIHLGLRPAVLCLGISAGFLAGCSKETPIPIESSSEGAGGGEGAAGAHGDGDGDMSQLPPDPLIPGESPGNSVFGSYQVLEFHFWISEDDDQALEERGDEEEFVPARASVSGENFSDIEFDEVGLRHKGAWSLHHCWDDFDGMRSYEAECAKLSYKAKFSEYDKDGRLDGLKQINLHASSGDSTKIRELLAYSTFRDFGIEAPRANPARVFVNDQLVGLFIAVEAVDGRFTKSRFPLGGDGNLYKETWPNANMDEGSYLDALETNDEVGDVGDLLGFAEAASSATAEDFRATMAPWVNLEQMLRYMAVDRALKNWDGITAFYSPLSPHNFFWYFDAGGDERFHLIPWDLDNTFPEFDPYMDPQDWVTAEPVPDWNTEPANCNSRSVWQLDGDVGITPPRCDNFLDLLARTGWDDFVTAGEELLRGPLAMENLRTRVAFFSEQLSPLIAEDPGMNLESWREAVRNFDTLLEGNRADFRNYLDGGLGKETSDFEPLSDEELSAVTLDVGLNVEGVTNFEFETMGEGDEPTGLFHYSDEYSTYSIGWSSTEPISGKGDLLVDFEFFPGPDPWDEWMNFGLSTPGGTEHDLSDLSELVLDLKTDRPRTIRIRFDSPVYREDFGDVWSEFGRDVSVSDRGTTVTIPFDSLAYPDWARDAWSAEQGWTVDDAEVRQMVISRFTGLIFAPGALTDGDGTLIGSSDPGFLRVDNLYFR